MTLKWYPKTLEWHPDAAVAVAGAVAVLMLLCWCCCVLRYCVAVLLCCCVAVLLCCYWASVRFWSGQSYDYEGGPRYDYECGINMTTNVGISFRPRNINLQVRVWNFMASLLDYVPYLAMNFILNMDFGYEFRRGFHWCCCVLRYRVAVVLCGCVAVLPCCCWALIRFWSGQ